MRKQIAFLWTIVVLLMVAILPGGNSVRAQDDAIEFPGEIMSIDGNIIVVGGIAVDVSDALLPLDSLTVGMTVQIIGTRQGQTVSATIVVITDFGDPVTPQATEVPPVTPATTEEPDTPVTTEEPDMPVTTEEPDDGSVVINNNVSIESYIVIEGPVEAISVDFITIFDIDIKVDPSDPVLTQIRIGDTIRVEGESDFSNGTVVIIAVNITIVQTTIVVIHNPSPGVVYIPSLPPNCKRTKKGKVTCKQKSNKSSKKSS